MVTDCSKHKKEVAGITDMKLLAEMIGDLHYETLADLFKHLSDKFWVDSFADSDAGKKELAAQLKYIHHAISIATFGAEKAWQISKPFMENSDKNV